MIRNRHSLRLRKLKTINKGRGVIGGYPKYPNGSLTNSSCNCGPYECPEQWTQVGTCNDIPTWPDIGGSDCWFFCTADGYEWDTDFCTAGYDECGVCGGDNSSCADDCGVPNGPGMHICPDGSMVCDFSECDFCQCVNADGSDDWGRCIWITELMEGGYLEHPSITNQTEAQFWCTISGEAFDCEWTCQDPHLSCFQVEYTWVDDEFDVGDFYFNEWGNEICCCGNDPCMDLSNPCTPVCWTGYQDPECTDHADHYCDGPNYSLGPGCEGYCGEQSGSNPMCYCNDDCWYYNDCCDDVCTLCGICNEISGTPDPDYQCDILGYGAPCGFVSWTHAGFCLQNNTRGSNVDMNNIPRQNVQCESWDVSRTRGKNCTVSGLPDTGGGDVMYDWGWLLEYMLCDPPDDPNGT